MATIRPFSGALVAEAFALDVPTPAHDAMSRSQRRAHVAAHATTYLRVERAVGDGVTESTTAEQVLREGRAALDELLAAGAFEPTGEALYLYRLEAGGHTQTGVVAELSAHDVLEQRVLPHEQVLDDKARHLALHFGIVGAQSSPILLGVRGEGRLEAQIAELTVRSPDLVVDAGDGVRQSVWVVNRPDDMARLVELVGDHPAYVVDGHHRVAATAQHAQAHPDVESAQWTLAVLYPTSELRVHEYNRLVLLADADPGQVRTDLGRLGALEPTSHPRPERAGELGVRLDGEWFRFELADGPPDDVVAKLDPSRLQDTVLPAVFGIPAADPDERVEHRGPNTTLDELAERADRRHLCALVLHPLDVEDVLAVADAGRHLPRKSTYFAPKARSGIFLRDIAPLA